MQIICTAEVFKKHRVHAVYRTFSERSGSSKSGAVFAQVEGLKQQAGVILATKGVAIPDFKELADKAAPPLNNDQEYQLHP